jgi:hypothetical protein
MNLSITKGDPQTEALLALIMDLSGLLSEDWSVWEKQEIPKTKINRMICNALKIAI